MEGDATNRGRVGLRGCDAVVGPPPATLAQLLEDQAHLDVLSAGLCRDGLLQLVQQLSWLEVDVRGLH